METIQLIPRHLSRSGVEHPRSARVARGDRRVRLGRRCRCRFRDPYGGFRNLRHWAVASLMPSRTSPPWRCPRPHSRSIRAAFSAGSCSAHRGDPGRAGDCAVRTLSPVSSSPRSRVIPSCRKRLVTDERLVEPDAEHQPLTGCVSGLICRRWRPLGWCSFPARVSRRGRGEPSCDGQ